jgi:uncharacterized short protein YbdD (DUF466 family)
MREKLETAARYLGQTLRLMVGLPDYGNYVTHMEQHHPGQPVMTYEDFFRERQDAQYGGSNASRGRRCC